MNENISERHQAVTAIIRVEYPRDWLGYDATIWQAVIDWMHRGLQDELRHGAAQARTLRDALGVIQERRAIIETNIAGPVLPGLAAGSEVSATSVLGLVVSVLAQLAEDLVERSPAGMAERPDRVLFLCIGRELARRDLPRPAVAVLRMIGGVIDLDVTAAMDDVQILHAVQRGGASRLDLAVIVMFPRYFAPT